MKFVYAAMFSFAAIAAAPVLTATNASAEVPQNRVIGAYMNSLFDHSRPWGSVPPWLQRMAQAKGGQSVAVQGSYGIQQPLAPDWDQNWMAHGVRSSGAANSWRGVDAANITDIIILTDNFSGPPVYSSQGSNPDPSAGGQIPRPPAEGKALYWGDELTELVTAHETNVTDKPNYWIYEVWADGGKILKESNGAGSPRKFAAWRERTTTQYAYSKWFDNLLSQTKANVPGAASRIKMIPVARTMVSVMENTPASAITADEWFEDDAPHGSHTLYLLAAMIVYSALYQEPAPMPDFSGSDVNDTFKSNYNVIADHIYNSL